MRRNLTALTLLTALVLGLGSLALAGETLMMATTTSTQDSGLLDYLVPMFEKDTGITLRYTAVGTGKALEHGKNCDVDVLLVHAPAAEKKYVADGNGLDRRQVMYNDFVLVGPVADPAGAKGKTVAAALAAVSAKKSVFVSRGDESGTHKAEKEIWKGAGLTLPDKESWYLAAGQGMMQTIVMAGERGGYTLTDRATWIKYLSKEKGKSPLAIIVEGDSPLLNQYSVIMVNPAKCPAVKVKEAKRFLDWWVSKKTQKAIAGFTLEGKQLFFPNAGK
ncbi:MAG: substrate-binding domain-containing protein [Deltaproteobacteria bacterium]|nr:substrate-binding domain-containing protein [Deltaproteobacteria bacterium]